MIRPNPQLIKQQIAEIIVTNATAPAGFFGTPASFTIILLIAGAFANALPSTRTSAICIENANSPHTPDPQAFATSIGFIPATGIAAINTTIVKIIQKTNASGRNRCTSFTQPFVNFLNIVPSPFSTLNYALYYTPLFLSYQAVT